MWLSAGEPAATTFFSFLEIRDDMFRPLQVWGGRRKRTGSHLFIRSRISQSFSEYFVPRLSKIRPKKVCTNTSHSTVTLITLRSWSVFPSSGDTTTRFSSSVRPLVSCRRRDKKALVIAMAQNRDLLAASRKLSTQLVVICLQAIYASNNALAYFQALLEQFSSTSQLQKGGLCPTRGRPSSFIG